jgi:hypothetical protein
MMESSLQTHEKKFKRIDAKDGVKRSHHIHEHHHEMQ